MSTLSNLYAEKIFSEHPTALWALDDPVDYLSLITENQRNMVSWPTPINGSVSLYSEFSDQPFVSSSMFKVRMTSHSSNINYTTLVSNDITNFSNLSSELGTFSIGAYINSKSPYVAEVSVGFEYNSSYTGELIQNIKNYTMQISDYWTFVSETFDKPEENTTFRIVIKIGAYSGGATRRPAGWLVAAMGQQRDDELDGDEKEPFEEVIFGKRRPFSLAIDWNNKMVYVLEFKRTSDQRRDYRENGEARARAQHDVLIRSLGKVAGERQRVRVRDGKQS